MKRGVLIAAGIVVAAGLLAIGHGEKEEAALPEIKVEFAESETEPLSLPGVETQVNLAAVNKGRTDVYVFVSVKNPVVPEADVWTGEKDRDDGWIPVVSFEPQWPLLEEKVEDGLLEQIYYYEEPLRSGETTSPLISSWHITNFTVSGGQCGEYTWEELCGLLDKIQISVSALQADGFRFTPPDQRWQLIN